MNTDQLRTGLHRIGDAIEVSQLDPRTVRQAAAQQGRRRRVTHVIGGLLAVSVGATLIVTLVSQSGSRSPETQSYPMNPGCGAGGALDAIGPDPIQTISVPAGGSFTITGRLSIYPREVSAVTSVEIIVGTPDSLNGLPDPSSAPSNAVILPQNQLLTKTFTAPSTSLTQDALLTLTGSGLKRGHYPVDGLLNFVNSAACGGHLGGEEISQFATLRVS